MSENKITLEEIESEIELIENQIEFEKKFNKLIKGEDFRYIFDETIFGTEMNRIASDLCGNITEDFEEVVIDELKQLRSFRDYISKRKVQLDVLNNRLSQANEIRKNILQNQQ